LIRITHVLRALSPGDRRALRTGLLVLVPTLSYSFAVKPYVMAVRRTTDALEGQRILLAREEEVIADMPAVRAEATAAAVAARRRATRTYSGTDSVGAMTAFGRDVTAALREAGLVVQRVEMRDSLSRRGELQEIAIDVRAQGDFEDILTALSLLEANPRLMRVSRLAIEKTGEHQPTGEESLSFVAIIRGYMQ
jgi:type II secretory pathway component PulM